MQNICNLCTLHAKVKFSYMCNSCPLGGGGGGEGSTLQCSPPLLQDGRCDSMEFGGTHSSIIFCVRHSILHLLLLLKNHSF